MRALWTMVTEIGGWGYWVMFRWIWWCYRKTLEAEWLETDLKSAMISVAKTRVRFPVTLRFKISSRLTGTFSIKSYYNYMNKARIFDWQNLTDDSRQFCMKCTLRANFLYYSSNFNTKHSLHCIKSIPHCAIIKPFNFKVSIF